MGKMTEKNTQDQKNTNKSSSLGLIADVAICAVISAVISFVIMSQNLRQEEKLETMIASLDLQGLIEKKMLSLTKKVQNGELQPDQIPVQMKEYTTKIMEKSNNLASQGVIVFDRGAIIAYPKLKVVDVTEDVEKDL